MDMLNLFSSMLNQSALNSPVEVRASDDIDKVLLALEKQVKSGGRNDEPKDLQIEAVRRFWKTGHVETLREVRLVAFGLAVTPWDDRRSLMEDKSLFGLALDAVDAWQGAPRQYRKCYQGLVRSYFDYDGMGRNTPDVGKGNWRQLRDYLNSNAASIGDASLNPDWVSCTLSNTGLFTEAPCAAYGPDLLAGNSDLVDEIRRLLGISDGSWFTRELVIAQIRQATQLGDQAFHAAVSGLLRLLGGKEVLRDRGLRIMLDRYVLIPQQPQHPSLRDYAVACWGNPWLPSNQDRWGGVQVAARQMVSNWLKLEFIELFFTKLAQDGLSDTRRVKFWAKYVPAIEEIHFALGSHAMYSRERDFVELRDKLQGLIVPLQDNIAANNAFIMKMGDLVAVEFSGASNAFYGYSVKNRLRFDLTQPVRTPVDGQNSLKNSSKVLYLRHKDNALTNWEGRFQDELRSKFNIRPGVTSPRRVVVERQWNDAPAPPPSLPLQSPLFSERQLVPAGSARPMPRTFTAPASKSTAPALAIDQSALWDPDLPFTMGNLHEVSMRIGASVQNRSDKGGALWVLAPTHLPHIHELLTNWGFKFTPGKGWWKKIE